MRRSKRFDPNHIVRSLVATLLMGAGALPAEGGRVVIADVGLISMLPGEAAKSATVVIEDGVITRIAPADERVWTLGDELIRGTGLWLIPGLIDGRVMTSDPADLRVMALAGVTSVVLVDDPAAWAWIQPLTTSATAGLPNVLPVPSGQPGPEALGLARGEAAKRWRESGDREAWLSLVDPEVAARWLAVAEEEGGAAPTMELSREALLDLVPSSFAGAPFMPPDRALVDELAAMADQGCTPVECVYAATRGAADRLGQPRKGRIEVGAQADLLLLEADPRADLAALRRIRAVVLRGQVIRAAERESTLDLLRELRGDQRRWLESTASARLGDDPDVAASPAGWSRRFLIRFDGMPRGGRDVQVTPGAPGGECEVGCVRERRELWSPFRSILEVSQREDAGGELERTEIAFQAPAGDLHATFERSPPGWVLRIRDQGAAGEPHDVVVELPDFDGRALLLADLWPAANDLRAMLRGTEVRVRGWELSFGFGPVSLTPRTVGSLPWPQEAVTDRIRSAWDVEALARSVAGSPWSPRRTVVLTFEDPVTDGGGWRGSAWWAGRGWAPQVKMVGAVGFDGDGWPLVGRFSVPEGMWEFHPVSDGSRLSPSRSDPRPTTTGTSSTPSASDHAPARPPADPD